MIVEALLDPDFNTSATQNGHSLALAGVEEVPEEMSMGARLQNTDLSSSHEEADPVLVHRAISRRVQGEKIECVNPSPAFLCLPQLQIVRPWI